MHAVFSGHVCVSMMEIVMEKMYGGFDTRFLALFVGFSGRCDSSVRRRRHFRLRRIVFISVQSKRRRKDAILRFHTCIEVWCLIH